MADNPYLSLQRFPGDGTTGPWEINFAGNRPDVLSGTAPYIKIEDVVGFVVTPATAEAAEVREPVVLTAQGPNTFLTAVPIPVGKLLLIERQTEDRYGLVDFQELQAVSEFDLDQANRQLLFLVQESVDRSILAEESAAEVRDVAQDAATLANEAKDQAVAAEAQSAAAQTAAESAEALAAAAQTASANALLVAGEAQATANGIEAKADQAIADSAEALATANEAMDLVTEAGVQSFNGRNGVVVPQAGDYSAVQVSRGSSTVDADLAALELHSDAVDTELAALAGAVSQHTADITATNERIDTNEDDIDALEVALAALAGSGVPMFTTSWWPGTRTSIPAGYAPMDGQQLTQALFPSAAAGVYAGAMPFVTEAVWSGSNLQRGNFTKGDGSTNFRLPDMNGKSAGSIGPLFTRGDGALAIGSIEQDALQNIVGEFDLANTYGAITTTATMTGPFKRGSSRTNAVAGQAGSAGFSLAFDASLAARTSTETRPTNVRGVWIVKLFGAVTNAGSADAAALATAYTALAGRVTALEGGKLDTSDKRVVSAWVNFSVSGTTVTILDSYNVSSVVRNGVGDFTVNFATALANANYAEQCTVAATVGAGTGPLIGGRYPNLRNIKSTTQIAVCSMSYSGNNTDPSQFSLTISGGK